MLLLLLFFFPLVVRVCLVFTTLLILIPFHFSSPTAADDSGSIILWDVSSSSSPGASRSIARHEAADGVQDLAVSPCGRTLAAGTAKAAMLFSIASSGGLTLLHVVSMTGAGYVDSLLFLSSDLLLCKGSGVSRLPVMRLFGGKAAPREVASLAYPAHSEYFIKGDCRSSPDGSCEIAFGDARGQIHEYSFHPSSSSNKAHIAAVHISPNPLASTPAPVRQVALSPCGRYAVAASDKNVVMIFTRQ